MRKKIRRSLALGLFFTLVVGGGAATGAPTLPLGHAGRWITDAGGRVVIVHGTNMVYKLPPYYPSGAGFGENDAAFLAGIGFNAVRLGVIWKAVEPTPGRYSESYLARIAATVRVLARHGVLTLLDFHQDLFNERFQGEGAPDWAVQDGGLPNPRSGFPINYLVNAALQHAFDRFWTNAAGPGGVGLQSRYAATWAHVAARFRGVPSLLGYEILNEPWPGTDWRSCLRVIGCPGFDATLTAFYRRVFPRIRAVDRRTLVWYEPNVLFNGGPATHLGRIADTGAGFAFHDYCLAEASTGTPDNCAPADDQVFAHAVARARATGNALMETEFGATADVPYLEQALARADRDMVPWLEWAYCACGDPTTQAPGPREAIVVDPARSPSGRNLALPTLRALVEPYPQVVAGTPRSWSFTRSTRTFRLSYSTVRAGRRARFSAGAVTEVATPALVYGGRYGARVQGGVPISRRGAGTLRIAACPRIREVTVSVTPSGRSRGSCRLRS
ncbi:MAG: cellulase family glycosylhydrolase [Solirubrobacterales bacterium]|nr:cellulase family glycosylhydrolase [Solirubrobacterales bacterium]